MQTIEPDGSPSKIYGASLQYHSTPTLLKALKNDSDLQEIHYKITTSHYPTPTKSELSQAAIPTLLQNNKHPYTAMDDIDLHTPQEIETIITTYRKRFYPQVPKQAI
jgi:hypothetical protein